MSLFHHYFPGLDDGKLTQEEFEHHLALANELHNKGSNLSAADAIMQNLGGSADFERLKIKLRDIM